jgi:hypothetical protein
VDLWAAVMRAAAFLREVAAAVEWVAEAAVAEAVEDNQNHPFRFAGAAKIHFDQGSSRAAILNVMSSCGASFGMWRI